MVKFIQKLDQLFTWIKELINSALLYWRCKKAIKRADYRAVTTGRKQLVLIQQGRPVVVSKQHLKNQIQQKKSQKGFKKGFTIQKAESMAIYITK